MPLKKHHKILIGSFSSLIVIVLIANSIFVYMLFIRMELNQKTLENQLIENQLETQSKINELTGNILQTKESLSTINMSINTQINKLKASTSADFSGIIDNAIKSVVTIRTDVSQGTGFIVSEDGFVITNAHLLVGGRTVNAINSRQEIIDAKFIGYNKDMDLAVLKIEGDYRALKLDNSNNVKVGEKVIAIGNPLGLQFSASEGIISAVHRPGPTGLEAYIQTDAALNPGNSGGPLINKEGKVIGINNFKVGGSEGIGFALESNYIRDVVNEISMNLLNETIVG